ncbi:MAG TPA: PD-(D/E)XK nuclease family protein, partial [Gammaproteobacteria bacterium]|nr:PD-(D/E)XK nuclease family protein [Gammaproteobacteria bacterium]
QQQLQVSGKLDVFVDEEAPAIPAKQATPGGSGIFKDQALCPFRSFARHRLHARGLQSVDTGLNPVNRGLLVHEVMQNFWMHDRDSSSLSEGGEQHLQNRIDKAIQQALKKFRRQQPETMTENFIALERYRLARLLEEWLTIEISRSPFSVREIEQWHTIEFAGMKIRMRIDRIDELADGRLVIIDYKTGYVNVNDWLDERPADPQLPLYAVTTSGNVAAIVYGKVKRGECKYQGLAAEEDLLPSVKLPVTMDWETQVAQWQTILAGLAREFQQGIAAVMPRDNKACAQCDLHGFCRIYERIEFAGEEQLND